MMPGFTRNVVPHLPLNNPFLIRVQLMVKQAMRQHMVFNYAKIFAQWVMKLPEPIVYPTVGYGTEWTCTICILY
jgi:hypothetical protein